MLTIKHLLTEFSVIITAAVVCIIAGWYAGAEHGRAQQCTVDQPTQARSDSLADWYQTQWRQATNAAENRDWRSRHPRWVAKHGCVMNRKNPHIECHHGRKTVFK